METVIFSNFREFALFFWILVFAAFSSWRLLWMSWLLMMVRRGVLVLVPPPHRPLRPPLPAQVCLGLLAVLFPLLHLLSFLFRLLFLLHLLLFLLLPLSSLVFPGAFLRPLHLSRSHRPFLLVLFLALPMVWAQLLWPLPSRRSVMFCIMRG